MRRLVHHRERKSKQSRTTAERSVSAYEYELLKSYVYRAYIGEIYHDELEVVRASSPTDAYSYRPKPITVTDELNGKHLHVMDSKITATLHYRNELYDISLFWEQSMMDQISFFIFILGLNQKSTDAGDLLNHLITESIGVSSYRNKALLVQAQDEQLPHLPALKLVELELDSDTLDQIFLPIHINRQINLFMRAVDEYSSVRQSIRYLFAGQPGTAKTKIIRAIANKCKGKATFFFCTGGEERLKELFEIVELFSPVVLCIDDLDMMTGSREEGLYTRQLANFLQQLDGFAKKDFFLLATTNDKRLVDLAASRPGRFDSVIDVGEIHPDQYRLLIENRTHNSRILELFDGDIFCMLEAKEVTGAFITNLIKHLELIDKFEPNTLSASYLEEKIKDSYRSFYKQTEKSIKELGFRN